MSHEGLLLDRGKSHNFTVQLMEWHEYFSNEIVAALAGGQTLKVICVGGLACDMKDSSAELMAARGQRSIPCSFVRQYCQREWEQVYPLENLYEAWMGVVSVHLGESQLVISC